jgi:FkbM family methyltransferase
MNTQRVKTLMLKLAGDTWASRIHGLRFAYFLKRFPLPDPEVDLLPRFLHPGDSAVDVGANGANWTHALHRAVGDGGEVFAFEADPYYARATDIAIRIMRMKGVRMFPFGLSDKNEDVLLRIFDDAGQRLSGLGFIDKTAGREGAPITLKTLDSLIDQYPRMLSTGVFKCDTEGYELFVFKGARRVIETARPLVILEVGDYAVQGYTAGHLTAFFRTFDYTPFAMISGRKLAKTDDALEHEHALSVNRVLIPSEKIHKVEDLIA